MAIKAFDNPGSNGEPGSSRLLLKQGLARHAPDKGSKRPDVLKTLWGFIVYWLAALYHVLVCYVGWAKKYPSSGLVIHIMTVPPVVYSPVPWLEIWTLQNALICLAVAVPWYVMAPCSSNEDTSSNLQKRQSKTPLSTAALFLTVPLTSSALGIGMLEWLWTHYIQEQYRRIVCCGWIARFVWKCESGNGAMLNLVTSAGIALWIYTNRWHLLFLRHSLLL